MLSSTACVILGLLQKQPMSGYDIKSHVDISTRFFFPASYGQIYPELKRLESDGLIEGTEHSNGRRVRTEYAITATGQAAFKAWMDEADAGLEVRDEGLLKFFFGGGLSREALLEKIALMRAERVLALERVKGVGEAVPDIADELQLELLNYGVGLYEYVIDWCDRLTAEIRARPASDFPVDPAEVLESQVRT